MTCFPDVHLDFNHRGLKLLLYMKVFHILDNTSCPFNHKKYEDFINELTGQILCRNMDFHDTKLGNFHFLLLSHFSLHLMA